MNPRLLSEPVAPAATGDVARDAGSFRLLALGLLAAGLGAGAVLFAAGARLPPVGPTLLLAGILALAVNRFALFPTELAVTAEGAVLVAAVVGFGDRVAGPGGLPSALAAAWCLALVAGPVDLVHLRRRSVVRMAYNSGSRMVSTVLAGLAFAAAGGGTAAPPGRALAGFGAVGAFVVVEAAAGVALVRIRNTESLRAAVRLELPLEALGIATAGFGVLAATLASRWGWWYAVPALVPALFVPELALVRWRRARPAHGLLGAAAVTVVPGAVVGALLVWRAPALAGGMLVALVVFAVVLGGEARLPRGTVEVPALVAPIVAGAVIVGGDAAPAAAFVAGACTTAVAVVLARTRSWWAPVVAGGLGVVAAAVYDLHPTAATAVGAVVVCLLAVPARRIVWSVPVGCVAVASAPAWRDAGLAGCVVFAGALALVVVAVVAAGTPPWPSRFAATPLGRAVRDAPRSLALLLGVAAVGLAVSAEAAPAARELLVPASAAVAGAVAAMAATAARQWRFAPSRRARDGVVALAAAVAAAVAYPAVALDGGVASIALVVVTVLVGVSVAWPLLTIATRARVDAFSASRRAGAPPRRRGRLLRGVPVRRSPAVGRRR